MSRAVTFAWDACVRHTLNGRKISNENAEELASRNVLLSEARPPDWLNETSAHWGTIQAAVVNSDTGPVWIQASELGACRVVVETKEAHPNVVRSFLSIFDDSEGDWNVEKQSETDTGLKTTWYKARLNDEFALQATFSRTNETIPHEVAAIIVTLGLV
ncbi:MAG: hypothetical protein AAF205_11395 [Pseudomonadota bacterium]